MPGLAPGIFISAAFFENLNGNAPNLRGFVKKPDNSGL